MADDPRLRYFQEADANIRRANQLTLEDPEWWATILAGIANAVMASVPTEVVAEVTARKENTQRRVQKAVRKGLKK